MLDSAMDRDPPVGKCEKIAPNLAAVFRAHKGDGVFSAWSGCCFGYAGGVHGAVAPRVPLQVAAAVPTIAARRPEQPVPFDRFSDRLPWRAAAQRFSDAARRSPQTHDRRYRRRRNKARGCAPGWRRPRARHDPGWRSVRGQPVYLISVVGGRLIDLAPHDRPAQRALTADQSVDDGRIRLQSHLLLQPVDEHGGNTRAFLRLSRLLLDQRGQNDSCSGVLIGRSGE